MSAFCLSASSSMVSLSTITPRSCTSNPLQVSTIPVMFLPISCTSPFTVASTTLCRTLAMKFSCWIFCACNGEGMPPSARGCPSFDGRGPSELLLKISMYGDSNSTASRMTLADLTTCGRNILPSPNSLPTASMPAMSGPSMTAPAVPYSESASRRSASRFSLRPLIKEFCRRCDTGIFAEFSWACSKEPAVLLLEVPVFDGLCAAEIAVAFSISLSVA